jgi:predicted transcriptional regulator
MEESWSSFNKSLEENALYHRRYHAAVSNPLRRKILMLIAKGCTKSEIAGKLNLSEEKLDYHLRILEKGFCIKREGQRFRLTKEGKVIYYLCKNLRSWED